MSPQTSGQHPLLSSRPGARAKKGKVVSAEEAVRVIRDGDTVATSGFVGVGFAEEIAVKLGDALQKRDVAPHIYESREEARQALTTQG